MTSAVHAQMAGPGGTGTTGVGSQFESQFWASVDGASDPALYEAYLAKYPNGTFADLARIKMVKLRGNTPSAPAPAPVPAMPPPQLGPQASPQSGPPVGSPQGTQVNPSLVMPSVPNATSQQVPGQMQNTVLTVPPAPAKRPSGSSVPDDDSDDEAPLVTDAPPSSSESGNSKLQGLLDSIRGPGKPQVVQDPAPPPAPPAPPAAPNPGLATPVQGPVPGGYGAGPAMPPPSPNPPYGSYSGSTGSGGTYPVATGERPIAVGALPPDFALPPRPMLIAVPTVTFPTSFCSADARNAFHNNVYRPAVEAATRNNDVAGGYLRDLQAVYDRYNLSGSPEPQNAVAVESRAYKQISDGAFYAQSALVSSFKALMAVPIVSCDAPK